MNFSRTSINVYSKTHPKNNNNNKKRKGRSTKEEGMGMYGWREPIFYTLSLTPLPLIYSAKTA